MAVYIVLGILYESLIHPLTIISTLPSASVGAMLALMMFHMDLNVISIIGIVLLIGIVKKNAIMMIDFALLPSAWKARAPPTHFEACILRFRPILMTTMAAIFGALPLASAPERAPSCAAAGNHHCRRPNTEPVDHPLHHAGGLPGVGPLPPPLSRRAP